MLQRVRTVALNTYRESVRARIFLGLTGVAFSVAIFSLIVGSFTLKNAPRVASDLGAASISIFSLAVAVIVAATSLHRELEQKTIFPILARPIHRAEYIVGKYLGTLLTILVFIAADTGFVLLLGAALAGKSPALLGGTSAGLAAAVAWAAIKWRSTLTYGLIPFAFVLLLLGIVLSDGLPDERRLMLMSSTLCFFEVAIVTAMATLFASFSTPFLSALLTLGLWIIGRSADRLATLPARLFGKTVASAGVVLSKVVPNLQIYTPARPLLTGEAVDANTAHYLFLAGTNALAWSVGFLALAALIFKKRDFL